MQKCGSSTRAVPGAGASGGVVGALAPHVPENWNKKKAFQFESLLMAETFWREVESVSGISPGYARLGRLQPVPDTAALALAKARAETAKDLWRGHAVWEVVPAAEHGWAPVSPTGLLVHDTLSARLHPRRACAALAGAITTRGGEILTEGKTEGQVIHATGVAGLEALSASHTRAVGNGGQRSGGAFAFRRTKPAAAFRRYSAYRATRGWDRGGRLDQRTRL